MFLFYFSLFYLSQQNCPVRYVVKMFAVRILEAKMSMAKMFMIKFCEAIITLLPKQDKDTTKKEN